MRNLLLTLAASAVAFAVGALAGEWYYGFAPAALVMPAVYFLLARRSSARLQTIMESSAAQLQQGNVEKAKQILRSGLELQREQFLVEGQIYAQLGAIEYMMRKPAEARPLLEKAWSRNWQAQCMLAVLDVQDGKHDAAVARLKPAMLLGRKEPILWAVLVWVLLQAGKRDEALRECSEGIQATEAAAGHLRELKDAIANDRMAKFKWSQTFGQGWYAFFPEDYVKDHAPQGAPTGPAIQKGRMSWPQPRFGGRPR